MADWLDTFFGRLIAIGVFIAVVAGLTVLVVVARQARKIAEVAEREVKETIRKGNGAKERSEGGD